jgi:murein DD-endopeptidase MepM/ murein hydrolase activator NlpD
LGIFTGRGWKLLVISDDESAIRQFRVPRKAVLTLLVLIGLLIVYALVETVLFWAMARRAAQVEPLKHRVQELEGSSGELARLTSDLARLKKFEEQLRRVLSGKETGNMESLPWGTTGYEQLPTDAKSDSKQMSESMHVATNPIGDARSLGGIGYTAMDVPTIPPVRGYVTRQYLTPASLTAITHHGLDIAAREGTPILASADGIVIFADWTYRYGNLVVIAHRSGYVSFYGHNQVLFARPGMRVRQGEPIALLGNSGVSTAPHLHFELWMDGTPIDPMKLLKVSP